jgi:type I restriction enzyme S subunit
MDGRKIIVQTERTISEAGKKVLPSYLLPSKSVCVSCIGWQMGKVVMTGKPSFTNQQINSIIPKAHIIPDFLYYSLSTRREELKALGYVGVRTPILNKSSFEKITIQIPPIETQQRIAAILSAYDDLIENNTRRIQILEEMARRIYEEWFVRFRFPGHENVRMIESELGLIPDGWQIVSFTEIADVLSGGTPKTTEPAYWDGDISFFAPKDISPSFFVVETEKKITELGLRRCNSRLYDEKTIFITARGTVGKVTLPASPMAMNQSCYALKGKNGINHLFLFMATIDLAAHLKKKASGATFDAIVVDTFRSQRTIKPLSVLIDKYSITVKPMFSEMLNLLKRNQVLRTTRDLLLPKLISGEIDVSNFPEPLSD